MAKSGIVNIALCCYEWISILDKHLSKWHLIRLLKAEKFTWKRVRKSLSSQRDRVMFEFFKQELVSLRVENVKGQLSLWYYDESGFSLNPNAMYAWLPKNAPAQLPAQRGNILTVAGFFS